MMKQDCCQMQRRLPRVEGMESVCLFPGIEVRRLSPGGANASACCGEADRALVVNHCRSGRIGWKMGDGSERCLGAGDFSIQAVKRCADAEKRLPDCRCEGVSISIDLQALTDNPPELLRGTGITGDTLYEKLRGADGPISIKGSAQTEAIFRFFYDPPMDVGLAYQRIKALELLLYLYQLPDLSDRPAMEYQAEQVEVIRRIHEQLLHSLDQRVTIEELSRQYLMNPTTMKALFKSVYGTSIAAHMKEHRMQAAARLLLETEMSIAEVALAVGYDSQSKFSTAFKAYFQLLPKEYRKKH